MDHEKKDQTPVVLDRRRFLGSSGLAAAGALVAPLVGIRPDQAAAAAGPRRGRVSVPPATRPGGAYDRYVAKLAKQNQFSGVVLLSHRGRTVLSRSYGMADKQRGVRNASGTAFVLSSAGQPFLAVAVLQLVQQGKLSLADTVGQHLKGFAADLAEQVNVHHLLTATAGISTPAIDVHRVFRSTKEVHDFLRDWTRQSTLTAVPGATNQGHTDAGEAGLTIAAQIVEAISGMTYWQYADRHVFRRAGMTGSGYFTTLSRIAGIPWM